ncbi:uncharacterized protein [Dermacentor andersoni]|uniref:uncharacterized protein n=1 Tax=Dermacentor andersoni TaxID=34620 RepID=UPI003B3A17D9
MTAPNAGDSMMPSRTEISGFPANTLANLESARGCFTGAAVMHRVPCTADEGRTCQIATHLSIWNEILCYAGWEVRLASGMSGQFCVVNFAGCIPLFGSGIESQIEVLMQQAATIVYWLLKTHRCLSTLTLAPPVLRSQADIVCNALLAGKSLKHLTVLSTESVACKKLSAAISGLRWLEELELTFEECIEDMPVGLSELLRTTTSLSTLRISGLRMKGKRVREFYTALGENTTLRDLSLHESAISDSRCQAAFARYLRRSTTLTSLTVEARNPNTEGCLKCVLRGLCGNKTVITAKLQEFVFDKENALLAATLLSENRTLRVFQIKQSWPTFQGGHSVLDFWLKSLTKNETLEELHLPLRCGRLEKWEEFFALVSSKKTLAKVLVDIDLEDPLLQRVCTALRESGAEEKVTLGSRRPPKSLDLLEYMEYSELYLDGCSSEKNAALLLNRLLSVDHITTVRIGFFRGDLALSSALADYIAKTSSLRSLYVEVYSCSCAVAVDITSNWWTIIMESLAANDSVRELGLHKPGNMDDRDLERLADVVRGSRNIRRVAVSGDVSAFAQHLSVGIADNYTLLGVTFYDRVYPEVAKHWFTVRDTANRNCDLVTRAALFVSGSRDDRCHVAALERVQKHAALLEELAEVLCMDEAEVVVLVRESLKCIESLPDFMRYAGVVKERLDFHPNEDGHAQLDILNEDCWRLVRRYLMLDDVRNCEQGLEFL